MFCKKTLWWILLLLALYNRVAAQSLLRREPLPVQWLTVKDGLSQGMIGGMIQDKEGYMWFGTKDGLNKYDGYRFTIYRSNAADPYALPDNHIMQIAEDENGNFWIATHEKGLALFDKKQERFYHVPTGLVQSDDKDPVLSLQYWQGYLLLKKTTDVLIYEVSKVHFSRDNLAAISNMRLVTSYNRLQQDNRFTYDIRRSIYPVVMPDGSIWIRTMKKIFYMAFDAIPGRWTLKEYDPATFGLSKDPPYFTCKSQGSADKIMLLNSSHVMQYDVAAKKMDYRISLQDNEAVWNVRCAISQNGRWFINTGKGKMLVFETSSRKLTPLSEAFKTNNYDFAPEGVVTDASGIHWIASNGFGVMKIDDLQRRFHTFGDNDMMKAFSLMDTSYMPVLPQLFSQQNDLSISNVVLDKNDCYWMYPSSEWASKFPNNKLICYDTRTRQTVVIKLDISKRLFKNSLYCDSHDRLWLFSDFGHNDKTISLFDKQRRRIVATYSIPASAVLDEEQFVSSWYHDGQQTLWLATNDGLFCLNEDSKTWKHWSNIPGNPESLSSNNLLSVCADPGKPNRYLWIGTGDAGCNRFDIATGKCVRYSDKDGLPNNVVYCILSDHLGNLWMSTNKGLSCVRPPATESPSAVPSFRNFTQEDGLPGDEFNRYSCLRMRHSQLMFGGVNGFVVFQPENVLQTQLPARMVFTGLNIADKPFDWRTDTTVMNGPIGYARTITLHPGQNVFTISFASLEYRSKEKKLYKYRLTGFDKKWTAPSHKNEATYTNLSPGTYTLEVLGTNSDGVWNTTIASIEIVVEPFWYQTWWFRGLLTLVFFSGLYGFYRYRLDQAVKLQSLRNHIAADLHDEIGSTLSSISIAGAIIQNKLEEKTPEVDGLLNQITTNTDNMMEAMSDIVWAVNTRNDRFDNVLKRMNAFAIEILEPKNIRIEMNIGKAVPELTLNMQQRKNLYLIFKEAINNAAKYAGCTVVETDIELKGNQIILQIKDNGKGFDTAALSGNESQQGYGGNGLNNMKKRAAELRGKLRIQSSPGNGTTIEMVFKV